MLSLNFVLTRSREKLTIVFGGGSFVKKRRAKKGQRAKMQERVRKTHVKNVTRISSLLYSTSVTTTVGRCEYLDEFVRSFYTTFE